MAARASETTVTFEAEKVIQPIYTGGSICIESHGRLLASTLGEQALISDIETGSVLVRVDGDGEAITCLSLTPDATHLILASRSCSLAIYALSFSEDRLVAVLKHSLRPFSTPVVSLSVDSTSSLLATGSTDGTIKVWDVREGYVTHTFRGPSSVVSALKLFRQTSRDGKREANSSNSGIRLASGSEDGKARVWDLSKKKAYAALDSHVSAIRAIDYSGEVNSLVTASRDKTIVIWDAETWKPRKVIPALESLESVGFFKGGQLFYSGGDSGRIRLWQSATGHEQSISAPDAQDEGQAIVSIQYLPSLRFLLCARIDQLLEFYDLSHLSEYKDGGKKVSLPVSQRLSGTHDEVIDFAFVSAGKKLMALATNTEHLKLVSTSQEPGAGENFDDRFFGADIALLKGHEDIIICLDIDWSGQWIATGAKDNTARLWYVDHTKDIFKCTVVFSGHSGSLGAITLPQTEPPSDSAAFSNPSSHPPKFLITGSQDQTVKRWNIKLDGVPDTEKAQTRADYTRKAHDKDINALAMNHDSSLFASASQDRLVKIWSTEEGQVQGVLRGHKRGVWSVRFGPKDTPQISGDTGTASSKRGVILTGSGDKSVKIWSLSDYTCLRTYEGHSNSVLKVIWFPPPAEDPVNKKRGYLVASAGGDGLVKVWDVRSGECVSTLDNHTERVWALTASPNLDYIVSGGGDGVVTFWADTTVATQQQAALESTARIEQEQELSNHIRQGHYRDAIVLALQLNHRGKLLALFTDVVKKYPPEPGSLSGVKDVDAVIASLGDEQIYTLLLRIRDWNANARTAHVAQRILAVVVKTCPASRLVMLKRRGQGLAQLLAGLRAYTERHYKRAAELLEESYLIDFVLAQMGDEGFEEEPWLANGSANGVKGDNDAMAITY